MKKVIFKVLFFMIATSVLFVMNYKNSVIETEGRDIKHNMSFEEIKSNLPEPKTTTSKVKRSIPSYEIDNQKSIKRIGSYNGAISVLLNLLILLYFITIIELYICIISIRRIEEEDDNCKKNKDAYKKRLKKLYIFKVMIGIILIVFLTLSIMYYKLSAETIKNHTDSNGKMTMSYVVDEVLCNESFVTCIDICRFFSICGSTIILLLELINIGIKRYSADSVYPKKEVFVSAILGVIILLIVIYRAPVVEYELSITDYGAMKDSTGKPIIYLYPEDTTNVHVSLGNPELILCSYPKYDIDKGWNVVAETNGNLKYGDNKNLYALYWEGTSRFNKEIQDDGFIVKGEDTISFLEEKLAILGLNEREAEEFIVYWLPQMEDNKYNYIRFETREEIDYNMPLNITPQPDALIRIVMDWCEIDSESEADRLSHNIKEQELTTPKRAGFVAVEWGGSKIK